MTRMGEYMTSGFEPSGVEYEETCERVGRGKLGPYLRWGIYRVFT